EEAHHSTRHLFAVIDANDLMLRAEIDHHLCQECDMSGVRSAFLYHPGCLFNLRAPRYGAANVFDAKPVPTSLARNET
ncbi:hypothetical protein, partial [Mesorhizobium sp. M4B.F.Ca.ET.190.01.1.1]|uniref:hypothetical protein n=1 Tax=Mesorhizobium sp. M4B.F.Ca.ET.190.01.1.1 TaxID=2563951 RepID=UPI001AEED082